METVRSLALAYGLAFCAGLNLPAAIAAMGLASRFGVIGPLPSTIGFFANEWIIAIAVVVVMIEFATTCVPGVGTAWETLQGLVRPPLAGALAAAVVWNGEAYIVVLAALGGLVLAMVTHTAKLGVRYALDTKPRAVPSIEFNLLELVVVTLLVILLWHWPIRTLLAAVILLAVFAVVARAVVKALRQVFSGHWMPGHGLLQGPRVPMPVPKDDEEDDDRVRFGPS